MGAGKTVDEWDAWTDRMKTAHGNGNGHGKSLSIEAARLLPTPRAEERMQHNSADNYVALSAVQAWGQYAAAIARAEQAIGRPAPPPTETGPKGAARLSPRFVEFLMMLPEGWVTDVAGLTRNDQLKMLGNGVVPAQCAAALRAFLWDAYGIGAAA
jgi:DNA (cytosine-5)-methyltransferase 1